MRDMREIEGAHERPVVYRSGDQFVKALTDQLTIPDSFFDVHESLKRASAGRDIQDPENWVKALVPKEGSKPLNANIDMQDYVHLNFSSAGKMPENISPNSKEGTYIKLLIGEARLRAVQKVMPETYATGLSETSKAIKEIQNLKKSLLQSRRTKINLNNLLTRTASGRVRLGVAIPLTFVTASLVLASCAPSVVGPVMPIPDGDPNSPTPTQPVPTETPTATPTATPTETPIPRVEAVICTSENFLDKDHEVDPESLFDGTYLEALRRTLSTPFDPAKIKNVPLWGTDSVIYEVAYVGTTTLHLPNFDANKKDTWPFQRFVTGYTVYRGITYAVMPIKFWNPKGEDSIVITLFKFDPASDDAGKKEAIKLWEDKMHITPILYPHRGPPDPLVDRTRAKYPDWDKRFRRFINNNMHDVSGQDMTALDGMVLLTIIKGSNWYK